MVMVALSCCRTVGVCSGDRAMSTLIFGTTYIDSPDREHLTHQWLMLTRHLNPDCDILMVDSASPSPLIAALAASIHQRAGVDG
jgi:hypothetical protein